MDHFVTLGEGDTPLMALPHLARRLGLARLSAKMESQNPTGSYKDRVAALSVSLAVGQGRAGWIASSSGNAGLAMAAYGARAGLRGFLCLVASAPVEKRLPLLPHGVELIGVDGVGAGSTAVAIETLVKQLQLASERHDLFLGITAHAYNPDGMRGIDTIGYELAEQAHDLNHLYVPAGGGGLLAAVTRGLRSRGIRARTIACQPSGCAPIVAYLDGSIAAPAIDRCHSGISALQIPTRPTAGWRPRRSPAPKAGAWRSTTAPSWRPSGYWPRPKASSSSRPPPPRWPVSSPTSSGPARHGRSSGASCYRAPAGRTLGRLAAEAGDLPVVGPSDVADHVGAWLRRPTRSVELVGGGVRVIPAGCRGGEAAAALAADGRGDDEDVAREAALAAVLRGRLGRRRDVELVAVRTAERAARDVRGGDGDGAQQAAVGGVAADFAGTPDGQPEAALAVDGEAVGEPVAGRDLDERLGVGRHPRAGVPAVPADRLREGVDVVEPAAVGTPVEAVGHADAVEQRRVLPSVSTR